MGNSLLIKQNLFEHEKHLNIHEKKNSFLNH